MWTMWRALCLMVAASIATGCGSGDQASTSPASAHPDDACAFLENITAPGVGPIVIFVTRGPGARSACDAEIADPRNRGQDIKPAYVPQGGPVCTYRNTHDPPPEGGRSYELFGDGAAAVCEGVAPSPPPR